MLRRILVGTLAFLVGYNLGTYLFYPSDAINNIVQEAVRPVYKVKDLLDKKYEEPTVGLDPELNFLVRLHNKEGQFFCSGFIISEHYVLTAGHCLADSSPFGPASLSLDEIQVRDKDGQIIDEAALPAGVNPRLDWGIVRGNFKDQMVVPILVEELPVIGSFSPIVDPIYMGCGFPMGQKQMFCSRVTPMGLNGFMIEGPGAFFPGMSGGPVIGQTEMKIVGIISYATQGRVGFAPLIGILADFYLE